MVYHTSWCPYCKYNLEMHNSTPHPKIDSEYLPCPKCRKLYKTGRKLWEQMDDEEKSNYYISEYFISIVWSFLTSFVFQSIIFDWLLNIAINWVSYIISLVIVLAFNIWLTNISIKNEIATTFEDALLRHWKQYNPKCDNNLKKANELIFRKYNCNFFELEKKVLPPKIYEKNKYNQLNERIAILLETLNLYN